MKKGGWMLVLVLIALFSFWFWMKAERVAGRENAPAKADRELRVEERDREVRVEERNREVRVEERGPAESGDREKLNRQASSLIFSKHARCRMGCRHISEEEVMDILRNGRINYSKSDMRGSPDPRYAIEGDTKDGQEVRIIFANSPRGIVVVTVIDLENEWKCNCK